VNNEWNDRIESTRVGFNILANPTSAHLVKCWGVDFEDEELSIPRSIRLSLQGLDLVVGCLQWICGDGIVIRGEGFLLEESQGFGNIP
jgi:hypothetical protein